MYDIIIVGGGPAGATLARLIGVRCKVLLLEKRNFREPLYTGARKCCGGLLDPDAQKMLASFGLGLPKSVILSPQLFAVRTIDNDNGIERYYQRHYINIDREEFDKWLESLIPSTVDIFGGCVYKSHEVLADHVVVRFAKGRRICEERAALIVGADGAFSGVRRASFPGRDSPDRYIAIQEWFEAPGNVNYYGAVFDSEITDFYSWLIPKEEFLIVGSALKPGREAAGRFDLLKRKLGNCGIGLGRSIGKNGAYLSRPRASGQICTGGGRVALVGEAAGFISPSSAEGISYAFKSALALSKALSEGAGRWAGHYAANTAGLRKNIVIKNLKIPFMYEKLLRKIVMKSGLLSINAAFDGK